MSGIQQNRDDVHAHINRDDKFDEFVRITESRGPGMMLSGIANMGLLIGSLVGVIQAL